MRNTTSTAFSLALLCCLLVAPSFAGASGDATSETQASPESRHARPVKDVTTRQGIEVEFVANPAAGRVLNGAEISAGDYVDLSFRLTDASTGEPLKGQFPGAWMDIGTSWDGKYTAGTSCKDRVGTYLQGNVGIRPLIDLNSYFILVMNRDSTITVIDPITGITGITKLYAQVNLDSPGADWVKTSDDKHLFVTLPKTGQVAVVDTGRFKVIDNVGAGVNPTRIALQGDGQYLWVGNNADDPADSGVTVIETESLAVARRIATGAGHHEIAFSSGDRYAFISNRDSGTVSVIDVETLTKVTDIATGELPISLAYSAHGDSLYVADGTTGEVAVIDGRSLEIKTRLATAPGLGPLRFSQDGRWAVAVHPQANLAYVIDASTDAIVHTLEMEDKPFQVAFSRSFAYVRSMGSERVAMIDLTEIGKPQEPPVVKWSAGTRAPDQVANLSIADGIVEAPGEAAVVVVSPADATVYYYMEGMNAPMGNFRNYGHAPVAVTVVDRSMQENQPGVYSSTVRLPEAGVYEVAFLLDSPSILHCFEVAARPNPALELKGPSLTINYLHEHKRRKTGETVTMRFRLADRRSGVPQAELDDVAVYYFAAPGGKRIQVAAEHVGEGIYEAPIELAEAGAWYAYVASASAQIQPADLPFTTFLVGARERRRAPGAPAIASDERGLR